MTKQVKIYHNPRCSKSRETLNLLKENGVETGIHWQPGHWFTLWKDCKAGDLSVTNRIGKEILSLPLHSKMSLDTVAEVCKQVKAYFQDKQA